MSTSRRMLRSWTPSWWRTTHGRTKTRPGNRTAEQQPRDEQRLRVVAPGQERGPDQDDRPQDEQQRQQHGGALPVGVPGRGLRLGRGLLHVLGLSSGGPQRAPCRAGCRLSSYGAPCPRSQAATVRVAGARPRSQVAGLIAASRPRSAASTPRGDAALHRHRPGARPARRRHADQRRPDDLAARPARRRPGRLRGPRRRPGHPLDQDHGQGLGHRHRHLDDRPHHARGRRHRGQGPLAVRQGARPRPARPHHPAVGGRLRLRRHGRTAPSTPSRARGIHVAAVATAFPSGRATLPVKLADTADAVARRRRRDRHGHRPRRVPVRATTWTSSTRSPRSRRPAPPTGPTPTSR